MSDGQEIFKKLLKEKGLKVTQQRLYVLEVLANHRDEHMAVEDIYSSVQKVYSEVGLATVYRTVQLLLEMQLVDRVQLGNGCVRYEIGHLYDGDTPHSHHHLICKKCGKILAFEEDLLEQLEEQIEKKTGFQIVDHELMFYGQCKECSKEG